MISIVRIENEEVNPPFNMTINDTIELNFTNHTFSLKGLEGQLVGIRKIKDWHGKVIGFCPILE